MRRGYTSLWLLLLVAFAIVASASCFDEIKIGGHSFKTAGFASELTQCQLWNADPLVGDAVAADSLIADSLAVDSLSVSKFPVPVDTVPKTILFFGDSMLEGLSPRLADYCRKNGHKLYTVIWYSSTTQVWGDCDTLSVFIQRYNPDYVVACLGANELFVKDITSKRKAPMKHLLDQIGDRPLLWIGPPNWKDDTGINDFVAEQLEEGEFFLSNGMTFTRKKDGAHPTRSSAAEWMDSVARWMPQHAAHPILMEHPDSIKGKANKVILLQPLK